MRRPVVLLVPAALLAVLLLVTPAAATPSTTPPSSTPPSSTPPSTTPPSTAPPADAPADVLTEGRDRVRAQVSAFDARLRAAEAAADEAQSRVDAAQATAAAAAARSATASAAAARAAAEVRDYAVQAFLRPPAQDALRASEIAEAQDAAYATGVLTIVADQRRQVVDTMIATRVVAERERADAESATQAARAEVDRARADVSSLQAARAQQAQLAAQLDDRLDAALAEAAALRQVNARVADDITTQEVALRRIGPASTPAGPEPTSATSTSPTKPPTGTTTPPGSTSSGGTTNTTVARPPTTTPPPVSPPGIVTWADVVKVGGIWVNKSVASQVAGLLTAARAAGINLGGGGYRDPAGQIAVRMANCGTSEYAIYQMPASQCTPPTARPGTSMHERGLAMDLQSSGHLITSRSDPAFVWLSANAATFGFHNLPSEPWHWSTTGT